MLSSILHLLRVTLGAFYIDSELLLKHSTCALSHSTLTRSYSSIILHVLLYILRWLRVTLELFVIYSHSSKIYFRDYRNNQHIQLSIQSLLQVTPSLYMDLTIVFNVCNICVQIVTTFMSCTYILCPWEIHGIDPKNV